MQRSSSCLVWMAVCGAGCGEISDKPDAQVPVDAALDAGPRCDPSKPLVVVGSVPGINTTSNEENAWLSDDELTIYVTTNRPGVAGSYDVFVATRASVDVPFEAAASVPGINTAELEGRATLTSDQLTMFLDSGSSTAPDLYVTTRSSTSAPFGSPTAVAGVNTTNAEVAPFVMGSGLTLYFQTTRDGADNIYRAARPSATQPFGAPVSLTEINTGDVEGAPVLSSDELQLFFETNRAGSLGGVDIYLATRASIAGAFGTATNLSAINTTGNEWPNWISPDGCNLYFTADRTGGAGGYDVWLAARAK